MSSYDDTNAIAPEDYTDLDAMDQMPLLNNQQQHQSTIATTTTTSDNNNITITINNNNENQPDDLLFPQHQQSGIAGIGEEIDEIKDISNDKLYYTRYDLHLILFFLLIIFAVFIHYSRPAYILPSNIKLHHIPESFQTMQIVNVMNSGVDFTLIFTWTITFALSIIYNIPLFFYSIAVWWLYPHLSRRYYRNDVIMINGEEIDANMSNNVQNRKQKEFLQNHIFNTKYPFIERFYPRFAVLGYLVLFICCVIASIILFINMMSTNDTSEVFFRIYCIVYSTAQTLPSPGNTKYPSVLDTDYAESEESFVETMHSLTWGALFIAVLICINVFLLLKRAYYRDRILKPQRYALLVNTYHSLRNQLF